MKEWIILVLSMLLAALCWVGGFLHGSTRMCDWLEENNLLNEEAIERYKIED